MLASLTRLLSVDFDVVGTARDGAAAVDMAVELGPDLVVLGISMPLLDGIEAARRLQDRGCTSRIVFYTIHQDPDLVETAVAVGASGYVLKARGGANLIEAIQVVARGGSCVPPGAGAP